MKILHPNTEEDIIPISKNSIFVYVTDYGAKFILKEIKITHGHHTWYWVDVRSDKYIDISEINDYYCTFDYAINRKVNGFYGTVYSFDNIDDMVKNWSKIKHIDKINTVYKSEDK